MANKKISELQSRTPALSDLMLVGDPSSGYSYKCTVTALATIIETDIADGYVTIGTTQTISGAKTFSNNLTLTSVANATTTQTKFLTLNGSNVVNYRTGAEVLSDIGGQGTISLAAIGSTPNANGATLSSNTLTLQPASASFGGVLTTGFQEIAGWKRFTGNPIQFDNHLEIKNLNSWGVSWGYTSFASKDTPVFGFLRGHSSTGSVTYNAWFTYGTTGDRNYTLPSSDGTLALTSDITSSISGTTNYIPKFTSTSAIGNSIIYETSSKIGVGTITPNEKLEVSGVVRVSRTTSASAYLNLTIENGVAGFDARGSIDQVFYTNALERMRIGFGGEVTLSTIANATTDTDKFLVSDSGVIKYRTGAEVLSDIGGQAALTNPVTGTGTTNYIPKFTSSSAIGNSLLTDDGTTLSYGSNIASIGATNTSEKYLQFNYTAGNFFVGGTNGENYIYGAGSKPITFYTNGSERMRLDASGNLGLGTSSPSGKLNIYNGASGGSVNTDYDELVIQNNGRAGINILSSATQYSAIIMGGGTGTGGIYHNAVDNMLRFATSDVFRLNLDASGNLGLGVTPSAWMSGSTGLQVVRGGLWHDGSGYISMFNNAYYDGSNWRYIASTTASNYAQVNGNHQWFNAPSGTAGNAISFTQAMTLDASGRLGIGTTSPTSLLHVNSGTTATQTVANFAAANYGSSSSRTYIQIGTQYGDGSSRIGSINTTGNQSALVFQTQSASSGVWNDAMYINGSGNVGIGTTSPATPLQVNGTILSQVGSNAASIIEVYSVSGQDAVFIANGQSSTAQFGVPAATNGLGSRSNHDFTFITNSAERMRITSGGSVGIGTSTFNYTSATRGQLALNGATDVVMDFQVGTTSYGYIYAASTGFEMTNPTNNPLKFITNNVERMRITSGGNVGINTSNPQVLLHIVKSSNPRFDISTTDSYSTAKTVYITQAGTYGVVESYDYSASTGLPLSLNPSGGNVGIGTTSPSSILQIEQATPIFTLNQTTGNSNQGIYFNNSGTNYGRITSNAATGLMTFQSGLNSGDGYLMRFITDGSERMRITSSGGVGINTTSVPYGNVAIKSNSSTTYAGLNVFASSNNNFIVLNHTGTVGVLETEFGIGGSHSDLTFRVGGSERARFTTNGELLLNTTSDAGDYKLQVNGNVRSENSYSSSVSTNNTNIGTSTYLTDYNFIGSGAYWGIKTTTTGNNFAIDTYNGGTPKNVLTITQAGNTELGGSIKTAAPSGGNAAAWKLGEAANSSIALNSQYVQIDINGTQYLIPTCYTL